MCDRLSECALCRGLGSRRGSRCGPGANFHGDVVILGRMGGGDGGGLIEIAGVEEEQGGNGPPAVVAATRLDARAREARGQAAGFEPMPAGVLLARPK